VDKPMASLLAYPVEDSERGRVAVPSEHVAVRRFDKVVLDDWGIRSKPATIPG